jgi:molybdenum cofactor biosynthesis enzyme MoaA
MLIPGQLGRLKASGLEQLGMTSNGISLHRKLPALVAAGLTHLNLSMDTLVPAKFPFLTRRPVTYHAAVMQSLEAALALAPQGLTTKINVVVMRGLNEDELAPFVELTRHKNVIVRFIEWMPFTGGCLDFSAHCSPLLRQCSAS